MYATGAAELRHVAKLCRTAVDISGVTSEMLRARGAIDQAVYTSVMTKLPKRGGLNFWVGEESVKLTPLSSGGSAGVTARYGKAGHDLAGLDDGLVIHPDNRPNQHRWYHQAVAPHTISDPIRDEGGDQLEQALVVVAQRAVEKIAHG